MSVHSRKSFVHRPHDLTTEATPRRAAVARILAILATWRERIAMRRHLATLDARSLRDVGISSAAAAYEAGQPFWRKMGPLR